ncbi:UNVERIFIED_CONTAM: Retrovirus-related Pol polyprotein from transposon RE2 [Sesamum latifolium]|uniref:Retrovirus-related Pol polyprotein from transposon RE2 n=1 Tax=Sesamum latifolium TaxID=2727402 RepID=A0AAW2XSW7_9LAMI
MTKKPFVGQSTLASGLLDLIHSDVCGPLNTQARGEFSYFITFTDDHSRYGYVYLMRYKSEAFGRFKELRLEVENQTGHKIKTLRSDRGGEYLSGEFLDYLKENGILSQWTPPGMPQLNGVSERRNRTLLDMVRSMMSFTELPLSFWGYDLETAAKLLNMAPSKTVAQTPYQIWHGKPASYKYLRVWGSPSYVKRLVGDKLDLRSSLCRKGFPVDTRREELLLEESSEATPQTDTVTSSAPIVPSNDIPVLRRSTRVSQQPERMDSMSSNKVWTLVDPPKGVKPIGCKWVYKCKLGADGEVTTFKARLVAKGYTQRPGVDFEKTYSPVAMAKSIRIMLAIAAWSIYGRKQASRSWNIHFDEVIRDYDFIKNDFDPCVYKKVSGSSVAFLVLYVDDILLIGNDVKMLGDTKAWLSTQFSMKDLGEASYILGIKIIRDRSKRMFGMTQTSYVEKVLKRFNMENSKRGFLPVRHGVKLSKKKSPKTDEELRKIFDIPYASAVGSIQYDVQCTRPDVAFAFSVTSRYQAYASKAHWTAVKTILQYLRRTKDIFLVYGGGDASEGTEISSQIQAHFRRYHLLREMVERGDVRMDRVTSAENMEDPLTKPVSQIAHA